MVVKKGLYFMNERYTFRNTHTTVVRGSPIYYSLITNPPGIPTIWSGGINKV